MSNALNFKLKAVPTAYWINKKVQSAFWFFSYNNKNNYSKYNRKKNGLD